MTSRQENLSKLFRGVVQFSPGTLQQGGGAGMGLYSKRDYYHYNIFLFLTSMAVYSLQRYSGAARGDHLSDLRGNREGILFHRAITSNQQASNIC